MSLPASFLTRLSCLTRFSGLHACRTPWAWLLSAVLAMALPAHAAPRPVNPPDALQCDLKYFEFSDAFQWQQRSYSRHRSAYFAPQRNATSAFNVLALSAGGEFAAYGAGYMLGWGKVGDRAQPSARADLRAVYGVSAGALLAPYTFLGDRDQAAVDIFNSISGPNIYRTRMPWEYFEANSFYDTTGKRQLIERIFPTALIDAVAKQYGSGRVLVVGMVNMDTGELHRIDLTRLAAKSPPKVRDACFRMVVGASSAIPLAFEPQFMDGGMWVDGGIRRHVFLTEPPPAFRGDTPRRLFTLLHSPHTVGSVATPNQLLPIGGRAVKVFLDEILKDSARLQNDLANACPWKEGCGKSGRMYDTFYASARVATNTCAPLQSQCTNIGGSPDMFCQPVMQCLTREGEKDGISSATSGKWLTFGDLCLGSDPNCQSNKPYLTMP